MHHASRNHLANAEKKTHIMSCQSDMPVTLVTPGKLRKFKIQVQSSKSRVAVWGPFRTLRLLLTSIFLNWQTSTRVRRIIVLYLPDAVLVICDRACRWHVPMPRVVYCIVAFTKQHSYGIENFHCNATTYIRRVRNHGNGPPTLIYWCVDW